MEPQPADGDVIRDLPQSLLITSLFHYDISSEPTALFKMLRDFW